MILLVDDKPTNLQVLSQALANEYEIITASNGATAIEIAQSQLPDLILLDIVMPGMDGYEVCRKLKSEPLTERIPIIFITPKDEFGDDTDGLALGATDYIRKPFVISIVKARIATHLALNQQMALILKMSDQSLQREKLFQVIAEQAFECSYVQDSNGNLVYATPSCSLLTGVAREKLGDSSNIFTRCLVEEDRVKWDDYIASLDTTNKLPPVEFRIRRPDGQERWVKFEAVKTTDRQNQEQVLRATARDITDRYRHTVELTDAKFRAEMGERAKTSFLATISHELRTPLNVIMGYSELLQSSRPDKSEQGQLNKIQSASKHLLGIIDDIMDYTRLDSGEIEIALELFEPRALFSDLDQIFGKRIASHRLQLDIQVYDSVPDALTGDSHHLNQIMYQLIDNGIKFSKVDSGPVKVRVDWNEQESEIESELRIEIEDDGIGMKPEKVNQLFRAFSQADESIRRKFGGAGIGLALTQKLAGLMQGSISVVRTAPEQGTLIELRLPFRRSEKRSENSSESTLSSPESFQGHVLVVEDNKMNQDIFCEQLTRLGLNVEIADNGIQGLALWQEKKFDLIITDIHMPELDGLAMVKKIRMQETIIPKMPIIAITADTASEMEGKCLTAGVDRLLLKPVTLEKLTHVLEPWLSQANDSGVRVVQKKTKTTRSSEKINLSKASEFVVLDPNAIAPIVGEDKAIQKIFFSKFIVQLESEAENIFQSFESADTNNIKKLSHKLKSSARTVGALALAELFYDLEKAGKIGDKKALESLMPKLKSTMELAVIAIRKMLDEELSNV